MTKTKKFFIWLVLFIIVVIGLVLYSNSKKSKTTYTTAQATKGRLVQTVSVTGDLIADEEITLNFEVGGRVNKIFVKEGQSIAAGEKVATLTDAALGAQVDQAKAALDLAIANANSNNDLLREAKVMSENAKNTLDQTKELNDKNVDAAQKAVDNAENYYDDAKDFYDSAQSPQNKLTLTTAENALNTAKEALKVAKEQAELAEINAENAVDAANSKIKTIESQYSRNAKDASVSQAKALYDLALINLSKATLISPVNGIITEINNKEGEVLGAGVVKETFSRVMSKDTIVQSLIPESDIVKIKVGQHAAITFDALSQDEAFDSEVIEIGPAATVVQDVVYYIIKLKLNSTDSRLKPGMSVNVDVQTAEKNDVIMVPIRAIKTEDKKKYVEVLQANNMTTRKYVETGLEGDDGMVEIKSGLKEEEKVVTFVQENK